LLDCQLLDEIISGLPNLPSGYGLTITAYNVSVSNNHMYTYCCAMQRPINCCWAQWLQLLSSAEDCLLGAAVRIHASCSRMSWWRRWSMSVALHD